MTGGVRIPIEAQLDAGDIERVLQQFTQQINKLGSAVASANKLKFEPVTKASVDEVIRITRAFENLRRVSGDLNKRMNATGQGGAAFTDVDWQKLYPDASSRARQMRKSFEYVTGYGFQQAPSGQPPAQPPTPSGGGGAGTGSAGRQIIGAGLNAMGPVGGVANSALSAGMAGGIGAGIMGFAGGLAAFALGKAIGAVREKIGAAEQENIGYDTLKRQLGDVNVSFGVLKDALRAASSGLDTTFEDGQRLGAQFVKLSGITGEQYKTVAEEVHTAGGFGRSFGMELGQSNAFFAQMRQFRVTNDEQGSRRLALLIGESIAKSDSFSKADEVLDAISGFTAQQTRMGLNSANVSGYASMLTGLIGNKTPGLDPAGAAALLGRVNASIAGGGAAGEAGQNFMYSALGSRLGLNPIQTGILREQGAFGTGRGTFGPGSFYEQFASRFNLPTLGAAKSDATNLQLLMEQFKKNYAGRPELMINAMSNLFGTNMSQSMALATIGPEQLGGLSARLKRLGVDIKDVNATGISRISQIEADGSLSDAEKDKRVREAATQSQERTLGGDVRKGIATLDNIQTTLADKMVPVMQSMRDGIMYLAGGSDKKSPREIQEAVMRAESKDRAGMVTGQLDPQIAEAEKKRELLKGKILGIASKRDQAAKWGEDEERDRLNKELLKLEQEEKGNQARITALKKERADKLEEEAKFIEENVKKLKAGTLHDQPAESGGDGSLTPGAFNRGEDRWDRAARAAGRGAGSSQFDALFVKYGKEYGVDPKLLKAIAMKESTLDPNAVGSLNDNGTRDYGLMQHNSRYLASRGITDWSDPEQSIRAAAKFLRQNIDASHGNVRRGVRMYNGSGPRAEAYADDVMGRYANVGEVEQKGTPLPEGPASPRPGETQMQQRISVEGTFHLHNPNGSPAAAPISVRTRLGPPAPSGAGG